MNELYRTRSTPNLGLRRGIHTIVHQCETKTSTALNRHRPCPPTQIARQPTATSTSINAGFSFGEISVFDPAPSTDQPQANAVKPDFDWLRGAVGGLHGYDLSSVKLHHDSGLLNGSPLEALTYGADVHLNSGLNLESSYGQHVLAHELTHTVQQATRQPGGYSALERDADTGARAALQSGPADTAQSAPLTPLPLAPQPAPQAFDPRFHRESVVEGLTTGGVVGDGSGGTREFAPSGFTDEEIGMVYQANWERDLSQLHPSVAEVMLAWKDVKLAAISPSDGRAGRVEAAEAGFRGAASNVLSTLESLGLDGFLETRAYGGYAFWEHMDNPGAAINAAMRDRRVELHIPENAQNPHLYVTKEYIKEMLFDAVQLAHPSATLTGAAADAASTSRDRRTALSASSLDYDHAHGATTAVAGTRPTSTIAAETASQVRDAHPSAPSVTTGAGTAGGTGAPPAAFEKLGRASHALEDFWSHSNFVEMAIGEARFNTGLADLEAANTSAGGDPATQGLTTSTFDDADLAHSKAHKIRALADEIDTELPLIEHLLGRATALPDAAAVRVGDTAEPSHEDHDDETGRFGDLMRAQQHTGLFDALIRNPATLGAGAGGYVGGALRHEEEGLFSSLGAMVLGTVAGGVTGLASGFTGGAMAGGNFAEHELGLGGIGGFFGAGLGALVGGVTGTVGGLIGGFGGSSAGYNSESHTASGGAVAGARLFGDANLLNVAGGLGGSRAGVALLRSVAENMENASREKIQDDPDRNAADRAGSHSLLAKDQPGHDDSSQDVLRTQKFRLSMALSVASDRMVIGQMRSALANPDPQAAMAQLTTVQATLDSLIAAPTSGHPLSGIIAAHRAVTESALTTHYQSSAAP